MNKKNIEEIPEFKPTIRDGSIYRLHHSTLWLLPIEKLGKLIIPAFMMGLFFNFNSATGLFTLIFIISLINILFRYLTLRVQLIDNELIIKSGKFIKNERRIHFDRIQDIEIHQSPLMRLFNVAKIQITTAASDKDEASLETLSLGIAEGLKQAFINYQQEALTVSPGEIKTVEDNGNEICRLSVRELITGGFTSFSLTTLMAIIGAAVYFLFFNSASGVPFITKFGNRASDGLQQILPDIDIVNRIVNILDADTLGKAVILILFGLASSIIAYVIRYYDYHLVLNGEVFSKRHGLLSKKKSSIDRNRVQALKIEEKLLQRIFHIASISVDTAGDNFQVQDKKKRDLLVPVIVKELATTLTCNIFIELNNFEEKWQKVSKQSVIRGSKVLWMFLICILIPGYFWAGWKSLILLPAFPFVYYLNYQWYMNSGYMLHESYILWRQGWLNSTTLYLPIKNIQSVSVNQTPFDRRRNLATLSIDTAGQSNTGGGPKIHHLLYEEAIRLQHLLARRASESDFSW